jgi:hypothetical protein
MIVSESLFHSHALASKTMAFVIHQRTHNPKPILSLFEKKPPSFVCSIWHQHTKFEPLELSQTHTEDVTNTHNPTTPAFLSLFGLQYDCYALSNHKSPRVANTSFLNDTKKHHPTCRIG